MKTYHVRNLFNANQSIAILAETPRDAVLSLLEITNDPRGIVMSEEKSDGSTEVQIQNGAWLKVT